MNANEKVYNAFKSGENLTADKIAEIAGLDVKLVHTELPKLVRDKKIDRKVDGMLFIYFLPTQTNAPEIEPVEKVIPKKETTEKKPRQKIEITDEQRKKIKELREAGLSYMAIEKELGLPDRHGIIPWRVIKGTL